MISLTFPNKVRQELATLADAARAVALEAAAGSCGLGVLTAAEFSYYCAIEAAPPASGRRPVHLFDTASDGDDLMVQANDVQVRFPGGNCWVLRGVVETWVPSASSVEDAWSALRELGWRGASPVQVPLPQELRHLIGS